MKTWRRPLCAGLLAALLLLAGCGQKGPLYLPEDDQSGNQETDAEA